MTRQQVIWFTVGYAVELAVVIYFTRAIPRRIGGAVIGGTFAGLIFVGIVTLGEVIGWWHWQYPMPFTVSYAVLFYIGTVVSLTPLYLITWRIARRFGWRGLAVALGSVVVIGPSRDYIMVAHFPEWGRFGPGIAPVIADAMAYLAIVAAGHVVMQIVAGGAKIDRLARQPVVAD
ncbi:MAG: hypothetical protein ACJ8KU_06955 [Chthoniobacterales bacterium]